VDFKISKCGQKIQVDLDWFPSCHLKQIFNLSASGPSIHHPFHHGVGHVLSHWTWLPSLKRQFNLSGKRFFGASGDVIIRLMTPRGIRYEDAYAKAHPFDKLIDGMLQGSMVRDTVEIAREAIDQGIRPNIIINNRAGGNAPLIAQKIATTFVRALPEAKS